MDGAPEVRRELQPPPGPDGEARDLVCQLPQDRPTHGLPERVLRSPAAPGEAPWVLPRFPHPCGEGVSEAAPWAGPPCSPVTHTIPGGLGVLTRDRTDPGSPAGLLCGHPVSHRDGHPGPQGPADPPVVPAGHLPPGLCAQGPGPHASQVSGSPGVRVWPQACLSGGPGWGGGVGWCATGPSGMGHRGWAIEDWQQLQLCARRLPRPARPHADLTWERLPSCAPGSGCQNSHPHSSGVWGTLE